MVRTASGAARGCAVFVQSVRAASHGCWSSAQSTSPAAIARVGSVPRLPRDGVRRPSGLRHHGRASPKPTRSSSDWPHRVPPGRGRRRPHRRPHRRLRAHPRPEVRRARAAGRAAAAPVAYIGAMGSRRTHEDRTGPAARGRASPSDELARLASPDRARPRRPDPRGDRDLASPRRSSLDRWGGGGERLTDLSGPIHHHHPAHDHAPS